MLRDADDAAREAALRVLVRVEGGAWSDRLLAAEETRLAVRRERAFLHLLVLTTLRWQGALDLVLEPLVRRGLAALDPSLRAILRLGLAQAGVLGKAPAIAASTSVSLARRVAGSGPAGLVNAVLRRALAPGPPRLHAADALPAWLRVRWTRHYGEARCEALAAASVRPARPFAVGLVDAPRLGELAASLEKAGLDPLPSRRVAGGWHLRRGAPQAPRAFEEGRLLLLDEGAALVASLARPERDGPVADLAAAPGGKATLLARAARGPLVAMEPVATRLRELGRSLRARVPGRAWSLLRADARRAPLAAGRFASVLLDAPCSGSGTLRRRPEKRHRLCESDVLQAVALQREMLEDAARLVAPGGCLVYAVCSLEPEEGREVVEAFLERQPAFRIVDPRERLGEAAEGLVPRGLPLLETRPEIEETEGFVAARFERAAD